MRRRGVVRIATLAAFVVLCATLLTAPAQAAQIDLDIQDPSGECGDCNPYTTLLFRGDPGERNDVSIEPAPGADPYDDGSIVHIQDRVAQVRDPRPSLDCQRLADASLLCPVGPLDAVSVKTGDGDDRVSVDTFSAMVDGGAGSDQIRTGAGWDEVDGGRGTDQVHTGPGPDVIHDAGGSGDLLDGGSPARPKYLGDDADTLDLSSRRRGIHVDLRTMTLTSRGERDRLRSIENVVPGRGNDTVIGNSQINVIEEELGVVDQGLAGEKLRDSGDDTLIGGGGRDGVASLGGDDRLVGGSGNDRLECDSEHVQHCRMVGGRGNDLLKGSNGPDRLNGGPGRDRLDAYAGNDLIFALDGTRDIVDGDRGYDRARVDHRDRVTDVERRLR